MTVYDGAKAVTLPPVSIVTRIEEFMDSSSVSLEWIKPAVRKHAFLPLYIGWTAVLGIRADGSFVRWEHERGIDAVTTLADAYWKRLAICQGARRYPELDALVPARPPSAETCPACGGSGQLHADVICQCGGIGWIISGEQKGPSPG